VKSSGAYRVLALGFILLASYFAFDAAYESFWKGQVVSLATIIKPIAMAIIGACLFYLAKRRPA